MTNILAAAQQSDFSVALASLPYLLRGAILTGEITGITIAISTAAGILVALARRSNVLVIRQAAMIYIWMFRGIPILVVLIFVYYAFPSLGLRLSPFVAAVVGMSLTSTAYEAEVIRAGIEAVPHGQSEAAYAIGMSHTKCFIRIVLPQAWRVAIPPYINQAIVVLESTSLVSVIAVNDITLNATTLYSSNFRPIAVLGTAGLLYLLFSTILSAFQKWSEKRYGHYAI